MKPGLCKALYTTSFWPICHYLYNGPYCAFLSLDKVASVCACVYTSAEDTPGDPELLARRSREPRAIVPPMAPHSGQLHLAHQGHFANKGRPLSLLFWGELSEEKVLIWFPPSHLWFIYKAPQKWAGYLVVFLFCKIMICFAHNLHPTRDG